MYEAQTPIAPNPDTSGPTSAAEAVAQSLLPGEHVLFFGDCTRKIGPQKFESVTMAVTQQRLLFAGPDLPGGFRLKFSAGLAACALANRKARPDGSILLILRHPAHPICLFFAPGHIDEAEALIVAIGHAQPRPLNVVAGAPLVGDRAEEMVAAPPAPAAAPEPPVHDGLSAGFAEFNGGSFDFGQELHALALAGETDEEEDY